MNIPAPVPSLPEATPNGRLVDNIMFFGRVLRAAGLPVGPGKVVDAVRAIECAGITDRQTFYWALHAVFVNRRDQRTIFDQAFHIFWRNPHLLERMMQMILPTFRTGVPEHQPELSRRVEEALSDNGVSTEGTTEDEAELQFDAATTYSAAEVLQNKDFEKMSAEEIEAARTVIAQMRLPVAEIPTRRLVPHPRHHRIDMRRTLRASLRNGGKDIPIRFRRPQRKPPPIVVLCDISGSMSRYSRMLLHFLHVLTNDRSRVHTFLFGTRLTNVTRYLRYRDVDEALDKVGGVVTDWSGGTRIGQCLHTFNRDWSRRVLGQGAIVLMISDGLDRDVGEGLAHEVERIQRSCRRLIWLNPLLRFAGFAPKSRGVRAMLPHVDEFRPVHSLNSLRDLAEALGRTDKYVSKGMSGWTAMLTTIEAAAPAVFEGTVA